jgi:translation elongation factor EF-Tu-like GTPase
MEDQFLFVVEHAFQISGRGCVLAPGLSTETGAPTVRVGSQIRLVTPEGRSFHAQVRGFEMIQYWPRRPEKIALPILVSITKDQVPAGTRVYLAVAAGATDNGA